LRTLQRKSFRPEKVLGAEERIAGLKGSFAQIRKSVGHKARDSIDSRLWASWSARPLGSCTKTYVSQDNGRRRDIYPGTTTRLWAAESPYSNDLFLNSTRISTILTGPNMGVNPLSSPDHSLLFWLKWDHLFLQMKRASGAWIAFIRVWCLDNLALEDHFHG
jgi:hypothetical protein